MLRPTRLTPIQLQTFRCKLMDLIVCIPEENAELLLEKMQILEEYVAEQIDLAMTKAIAPFIGIETKRRI
jgi:hypothetical protein